MLKIRVKSGKTGLKSFEEKIFGGRFSEEGNYLIRHPDTGLLTLISKYEAVSMPQYDVLRGEIHHTPCFMPRSLAPCDGKYALPNTYYYKSLVMEPFAKEQEALDFIEEFV